MNDQYVINLALGHHDVDQGRRRRMNLVEVGRGLSRSTRERMMEEFPWKSPRVILQHLERDMNTAMPTTWVLDSDDGSEAWKECGQQPGDNYRDDKETSQNQYIKIWTGLVPIGRETPEATEEWKACEREGWIRQEWQRVKIDVENMCVEMYT